jgi:hypothetical protein
LVTSEGNAPACPIRDNNDAVDHVMNIVYRIVPRLPSSRVISSAGLLVSTPANTTYNLDLATRGEAYINALTAAVEALPPPHAVPLKKDTSFFWTYKIKVHTKWALDSGLPPDVVRLLATIHFS